MIRSVVIGLFLGYFTLGALLLPRGDFSVLPDLPAMYRLCQSREDVDMTLFDFVTDHLLNIDGVFDPHDHGDHQKPHQPFDFHHQTLQPPACPPAGHALPAMLGLPKPRSKPYYSTSRYRLVWARDIFHPPCRS